MPMRANTHAPTFLQILYVIIRFLGMLSHFERSQESLWFAHMPNIDTVDSRNHSSFVLESHCKHRINKYWTAFLGEIQGWVPPHLWPQYFHQQINIEPLFCLNTSYLIYSSDSLTLNSQLTALSLRPEWSLSNTNISSVKPLGHSDTVGGSFKQQNHQ